MNEPTNEKKNNKRMKELTNERMNERNGKRRQDKTKKTRLDKKRPETSSGFIFLYNLHNLKVVTIA